MAELSQTRSMTATLSKNGLLAIPEQARIRHKRNAGTEFTVITRSNGEIILRRSKTPRRHATFAKGLRALSGLDLSPERRAARAVEL